MLIVLHTCLFLMSYDSGYTSLGDRGTIVTTLGKFDFQMNYLSDGSYIGFNSQPSRML